MKWWEKISNIGLSVSDDMRHIRHVHLLNRIIFLVCFFTYFYIPVLIFVKAYFFLYTQLICGILFLLGFWLSYKKMFRAAAWFTYCVLIANVTLVAAGMNEIGAEFLMIPACLSAFVAFKSRRDALVVLGLFLAACAAAQVLKHHVTPFVVLEEPLRLTFYYTDIFIGFIASSAVILVFMNVIDNYEETVLGQKKQIEERNKEITDSIHYAKRIQRSLLPTEKYLDRVLKKLRKE